MRNLALRTFCCTVALASTVCGPWLSMAVAIPPAIPDRAEIGEPQDVIVSPPLAFLKDFWNEAWNLDFVLGESGMLLEEMGTNAYQILVTDTQHPDLYVAEGTYIEDERLVLESPEYTQEELDEAEIISFDHYVVTGSIIGSTGWGANIAGIAMVVVLPSPEPGADPVLVHSLTPVDSLTPLNQLDSLTPLKVTQPDVQRRNLSGRSAFGEDDCSLCRDLYDLCKAAAKDRAKARDLECFADALIQLTACGFGSLACGPAALACQAVCSAAVLAAEALCLLASSHQLNAALAVCLAAKWKCYDEAGGCPEN